LHPDAGIGAITLWEYGFFSAMPRITEIKLRGFISAPLQDPDFDLVMKLRFHTTNALSFTYPSHLALCARLEDIHVGVHSPLGLFKDTIRTRIRNGIANAFWRGQPDPNSPEVPDGSVLVTHLATGANQKGSGKIDVLEVIATSEGGLSVLLNPLPPPVGDFRKLMAERNIATLLES
jgi:hypothetical protein